MRVDLDCTTWKDYHGNWKRKDDTITFGIKHEIEVEDARFTFSNKIQNRYYFLEFETDNDSKLTHKKVEILLRYDYRSNLQDIKLEMELDSNFSLRIPFSEIPHRGKLASIRYEYILPNGETRMNFLKKIKVGNQKSQVIHLNKKDGKVPNQFKITLIEKPINEYYYRITKGILSDNKITIISNFTTRSDLNDYLKFQAIEFKGIYESTDR